MVFKRLFQALKGDAKNTNKNRSVAADPVSYKEMTITAAPISEGGQFKTAGSISCVVDGVEKRTEFIRADNHTTAEAAVDHSVNKAKQLIDERGAALFSSERC